MNKRGMLWITVALAGAAAGLWFEHREHLRERERNQTLRQAMVRLSQRNAESRPMSPLVLPAGQTSLLPGEQWRELLRLRGELGVLRREQTEMAALRGDNSRLRSNWVEQLMGGKKLSLRQIEPFLKAKQRNAESLMAAARVTGESGLLREARQRFPTDPRVNFAAYFAERDPMTAEERRQRLEAFKQSAPENALANYLSARDYLKSGRNDEAVKELIAASTKPQFQDYYAGFVQNAEDAYRAAGLSDLESAMVASGQPMPQLAELKGLGESLVKLASLYQQGGDEASARAVLQMGVTLARQVGEPVAQSSIIGEFVGVAIERQVLEAMDPASRYDATGRSVKDRLDELRQQREDRKALLKQSEPLLKTLSPSALKGYYDRLKASGEAEALRWVISHQPAP